MPDDARCFSDAETLLSERLRQREQVGRADGRCFSDAETLREQAGKPFRQSPIGETPLALASPFGRRPRCLTNALPPQRTGSPMPHSPFPNFRLFPTIQRSLAVQLGYEMVLLDEHR
ncbi:MAG: hypothetical protein KME22_17980 [Hassallia sp. WJT32-NPBG1]|nr:hypothetical protein [Hassallia sp. WJT32-NPBG1]